MEKVKKPIYKRVWFIVLMVILVLGAIGSMSESDDTADKSNLQTTTKESVATETTAEPTTVEVKEPMEVTVDELMDALNNNALKATNTYKDQYVKLTGKLNTIDAQGDYFSLTRTDGQFEFIGVMCYIEESHLDQVMEFEKDQTITVIGTISDVGEVLGYSLKVESIE